MSLHRDRLTESIYCIICLYESGDLTEGQATKLMNCGDRVSFRLTREKVLKEMKGLLAKDMEAHGWKWLEENTAWPKNPVDAAP